MKVFIARHGDAAHLTPGRERELTPRGLRDANLLGQLLALQMPQHLLFSPKLRTEQTANLIQSAHSGLRSAASEALMPPATPVQVAAALENFSSSESVVLVSHLPLVAELVAWFVNGDSADYRLPGFPAAGVVSLEMAFVGRGQARLDWYAFPPEYQQKRH